MLRFSVLKPEAPSADKKQPPPRPEDKGKRAHCPVPVIPQILLANCGVIKNECHKE